MLGLMKDGRSQLHPYKMFCGVHNASGLGGRYLRSNGYAKHAVRAYPSGRMASSTGWMGGGRARRLAKIFRFATMPLVNDLHSLIPRLARRNLNLETDAR